MIVLERVTKIYATKNNKHKVLDDINLTFSHTGLTCILGSSGCGKTTLLNLIGGIDTVTSGAILIDGQNIDKMTEKDKNAYRNECVGFVFQRGNLIADLTVRENVRLALDLAHEKNEELVSRTLEKVGMLSHADSYPNTLSGGELQRVAVARAIINNPKVILADEPTGALDEENSVSVMQLLKELSKERLVIVVTHNRELAKTYSDRTLNIKDGKIISDSCDVVETHAYTPYHKKNVGMGLKTTLALATRSLKTNKLRSIISLIVQTISVLVLCAVLTIEGWITGYCLRIEGNLLSVVPVTAGSRINISKVFTDIFLGGDTQENELEKIFVNKVAIEVYKQLFNTLDISDNGDYGLSDEYIEYAESVDSNLYTYAQRMYRYNITKNLFTRVPVTQSVNKTVSLGHIFDKVEEMSTGGENLDSDELDTGSLVSQILKVSDIFFTLPSDVTITESDGELIGKMPEDKSEMLLVVDENGYIPDYVLALIGFYPPQMLLDALNGNMEDVTLEWDYEDIFNKKYLYLNNDVVYEKKTNGYYINDSFSESRRSVDESYSDAINMNIVGILKKSSVSQLPLLNGVYYTEALENYIFTQGESSNIIRDMRTQLEENTTDDFYSPLEPNKSITKKRFISIMDTLNAKVNPVAINYYTSVATNKTEIVNYLQTWNDTHPDEQVQINDGFSAIADTINSVLSNAMLALKILAIVIVLVVAFMVSIISFMNAKHRAKEFGIMRCIGAKNGDVVRLLSFENGIIGIVAGIIGLALSYGAVLILYSVISLGYTYFMPIWTGLIYALAICIVNTICSIVLSLKLVKSNLIQSVSKE